MVGEALISSQMNLRCRNIKSNVNYICIEKNNNKKYLLSKHDIINDIVVKDNVPKNIKLNRNTFTNQIIQDEYFWFFVNYTQSKNHCIVNYDTVMNFILREHGFNVINYTFSNPINNDTIILEDIDKMIMNYFREDKNYSFKLTEEQNNLLSTKYDISDIDDKKILIYECLKLTLINLSNEEKKQHLDNILNSELISTEQYLKLEKKNKKTNEDYCKISKYLICKNFNIENDKITENNINFLNKF